jgi:DNA-binding response OmpR family regulator
MRVLIVEDQKVVAHSLAAALSDAGHEVVGPAFTSREALSLVQADRLDAAFVDVDLEQPGVGIAIAQELARDQVPVIFTTAHPDRVRACGTGLGLFTKPYDCEYAVRALGWIHEHRDDRPQQNHHASSFEWLPRSHNSDLSANDWVPSFSSMIIQTTSNSPSRR